MDLIKDLTELRLAEIDKLKTEGFIFPSKQEIEQMDNQTISDADYNSCLITLLHNCYSKMPAPVPREIVKCSGFCCPPQHTAGLAMIENEIAKGDAEALKKRLSRQIFKTTFKDSMMFDFGVCHLHLGTQPDPRHSSMMQGFKEILYVMFTPEKAVFITVDEHGRWNDRKLLESVYDSYPDVMEPFKSPLESVDDYTDEERAERKDANTNTSLKIRGITFMPPGGGFTMSGTSLNGRMAENRQQKFLDAFQKSLSAYIKDRNLENELFNGKENLKMTYVDFNTKQIELNDEINKVKIACCANPFSFNIIK